jgi:hypothetical protein
MVRLTLLIPLLMFGRQVVLAQGSDRDTLRGLKAINVLVEKLPPDAESRGMSEDTLRTDIELRLRRNGVKVPVDSGDATRGGPYLYLNVNFKCSQMPNVPACGDSITLQVRQRTTLVRDPSIESDASTWDASVGGIVGQAQLAKAIRQVVADLVDRFVNDFLAVNPK